MKNASKKLALNQETLRNLTQDDLSKGKFATHVACTNTCVSVCRGTCPVPPAD